MNSKAATATSAAAAEPSADAFGSEPGRSEPCGPGCGAGAGCSGQVQVITDLLGLTYGFIPKHAKQYAKIAPEITEAVRRYVDEVKGSTFPTAKESHGMNEEVLKELQSMVGR